MYIATSLVLWFFGLPSLGFFVGTDTDAGLAGNSLDQYLAYARNQALQRRQPITVCSSKSALQCDGDNAWTSGWIVFVDADRHPGQLNAGDQLLLAYQVQGHAPGLGIDAKYVRYLGNGAIELD